MSVANLFCLSHQFHSEQIFDNAINFLLFLLSSKLQAVALTKIALHKHISVLLYFETQGNGSEEITPRNTKFHSSKTCAKFCKVLFENKTSHALKIKFQVENHRGKLEPRIWPAYTWALKTANVMPSTGFLVSWILQFHVPSGRSIQFLVKAINRQ